MRRRENPQSPLNWRVEKMRLSKDKTSLTYNDFLTLDGIPPETFEYRLGNRSALEWVIDQYQVSTDKRSGITNDPNRPDDPEYIVRLLGQVITVSLETVKVVKGCRRWTSEVCMAGDRHGALAQARRRKAKASAAETTRLVRFVWGLAAFIVSACLSTMHGQARISLPRESARYRGRLGHAVNYEVIEGPSGVEDVNFEYVGETGVKIESLECLAVYDKGFRDHQCLAPMIWVS